MTREQFLAAAAAFYDMLQSGATSGSTSNGAGNGSAPKFDTRIARKGGMVQWASECSLKELTYWRDIAAKPPSDPKYAESNAKQAKALEYWMGYRRAEPGATWTGERNRVVVTAKPPSDKPQQYPRDAAPEPAALTPSFDDADAYGFDDEAKDDQLPF